jgi:hypothetical protein
VHFIDGDLLWEFTTGLNPHDIFPLSLLLFKPLFLIANMSPLRVGSTISSQDFSGIEGPGSCPAVTTVGVCVENCNSNSSCTGGQKCCFNGCGHVCIDPVSG